MRVAWFVSFVLSASVTQAAYSETAPVPSEGPRATTSQGQTIFESLSCTSCHNMDGTESIGPSLHDVGLHMSEADIRRQLLSPYRGRSVFVEHLNGQTETLQLLEETDTTLKVRHDGATDALTLVKKDLETFAPLPSQMPTGTVKSLSAKQLDTLVEFLTQQQKTDLSSRK